MNKVDLLFIIDITGSMGGLIQEAQQKMHSILDTLSKEAQIDLRVGLSLYRDHPSQGDSFVTAVFDLDTIDETKKWVDKISVGGGGDTPEAVLDGIFYGINEMSWREGSRRISFLIADAPAKGMNGEGCCACGLTAGKAIWAAENKRVIIYSICLSNNSEAQENFKLLSNYTGGFLIEEEDAMKAIMDTLKSEFENINLESQILKMMSEKTSPEKICKMLGIDRDKLSEAQTKIFQYSA